MVESTTTEKQKEGPKKKIQQLVKSDNGFILRRRNDGRFI